MYLQFREYDISGPSLRIQHSNANFFIQDWFSNKNFGEKSMYNTIHSSDNRYLILPGKYINWQSIMW